jgi:hypothetical protein
MLLRKGIIIWLGMFHTLSIMNSKADPINATIGLMFPISVTAWRGYVPLSFQQMATAAILAIHHVNKRDGSVVGEAAVNSLPADFRLTYKLVDTRFSIAGGVKAILDWRAEEGYDGFSSSCGAGAKPRTNATKAIYATYSASEKIASIVGPDLSEISAAVTVIAALGGTPVTSYFSTSTTLSDKGKFPLFSRTVPVQSFNTYGMVSVMRFFGWRQCAVLYSDSEYGSSFAADFQQQANTAAIAILLYQKFKDTDAASLRVAADAARRSDARVLVFLAQGGLNLQGVLLAANASGIGAADGYAWIAGELGSSDPEDLFSGLSTPPAALRPLLQGWLSLSLDALTGARRAVFEAAYAAADPAAVYDPLVAMPAAGLAPPRSAYDAFAYDAVWATALGVAAAHATRYRHRRGRDSRSVLGAIRSCAYYINHGVRLLAALGIAAARTKLRRSDWSLSPSSRSSSRLSETREGETKTCVAYRRKMALLPMNGLSTGCL